MVTVNIQVKTKRQEWDYVAKIQHTFENEVEVAKFAYRLALQFEGEVRVTGLGSDNGRYFNHAYAEEYLKKNFHAE